MHTESGQVGDVYDGMLPALLAQDIHPAVAMAWLRRRISWPIIIHVLILARKKTIVTIFAPCHIDDHISLFHRMLSLETHFSI
jgi:hypothetical protein